MMAGLENQIFTILSDEKEYHAYRDHVPEGILSPVGKKLLKYVDDYWSKYAGEESFEWRDFAGWLRYSVAPKDGHLEAMEQLCEVTADVETEEVGRDVLNKAVERDVSERIEGHLESSDELDVFYLRELADELESFKASDLQSDKFEIETDIEEVLKNSHITDEGLPFSLECLQTSVGPLRPGDTVYVVKRPEVGGCLGRGTPVLLYDGSTKPVEDVSSTDVLMGPDSTPRYPRGFVSGVDRMYRVTYPWGDSYVVNESHILSLKRSKVEAQHQYGDILNVPVSEYLNWPSGRKERYKGWKTGVDFPHVDLASHGHISPYIMGAWLGDGNSDGPRFTSADSEVVEAFREEGERYGLRLVFVTNENTGNAATYSLSTTKGTNNPMLDDLRYWDVCHNKHIPEAYLKNAESVRLQVLAGLIDTDGYAGRNSYEIIQVRKNISEDILYLARSLGYHATIKEKPYRNHYHYRVMIYGNFEELSKYIRVSRKRIVPHEFPKRKGLQFGIQLEYVGMDEFFGFAVDSDNLFLLGDFTVTHNTTFLLHQTGYMMQNSTDTSAVVFSNEEDGNRVMIRLYQSVLGWDTKDILADPSRAKSEYESRMGSLDRVRIVHKAGLHRKDCERVIEKYNPDLIIFNMLSKIGGFGNKWSQDVDVYSSQGVWMRELANGYNCAAMTAWQAGGAAHGKAWVEQDDMYGSKTGVVAEADVILGIGKLIDPYEPEDRRYIHLSKNKLPGDSKTDEKLRHGYFDSIFIDTAKGRFYE